MSKWWRRELLASARLALRVAPIRALSPFAALTVAEPATWMFSLPPIAKRPHPRVRPFCYMVGRRELNLLFNILKNKENNKIDYRWYYYQYY
ncbi:MAG: hypothetical protein ACJAWP_000242 [Porticoccus sp.]|jgi:hypothetical protein